jgi:hypothetical protein
MAKKTFKRHYVEFRSPGTLYAEESSRPIEAWDTAKACELAKGITERHGAKPFAFKFITMLEADPIDDGEGGTLQVQSRRVAESGTYFIGGTILSIDDVIRRNEPSVRRGGTKPTSGDDGILIENMRRNDWPYAIEIVNVYRSTWPFLESDLVVDPATGEVIERGDTDDRKAYRKRKIAEHRAEMDREYGHLVQKA